MKSNAIAAVGIALIDLPLAVKPDLLFRIACTEMKGSAGATLASLAVEQVHPIRFTGGNYSKGATVALRGSFHRSPPSLVCPPLWPVFWAAVEPLRTEVALARASANRRSELDPETWGAVTYENSRLDSATRPVASSVEH
jgi:hypothetical protein